MKNEREITTVCLMYGGIRSFIFDWVSTFQLMRDNLERRYPHKYKFMYVTQTTDNFFYLVNEEICNTGKLYTKEDLDRMKSNQANFFKSHINGIKVDIVYHITSEDSDFGIISAFLKLNEFKDLGSDHVTIGLCYDKIFSDQIVSSLNIDFLCKKKSLIYTKGDKKYSWEEVEFLLGEYGFFWMKHPRSDSCGDVYIIKDKETYEKTLELVFKNNNKSNRCIMEENIPGEENKILVIESKKGAELKFYNNIKEENKYLKDASELPKFYEILSSSNHLANGFIYSEKINNQLKFAAEKIFRAFDVKFVARIDVFVTPDKKIYFNEIHTIPGYSHRSSAIHNIKTQYGIAEFYHDYIEFILSE